MRFTFRSLSIRTAYSKAVLSARWRMTASAAAKNSSRPISRCVPLL